MTPHILKVTLYSPRSTLNLPQTFPAPSQTFGNAVYKQDYSSKHTIKIKNSLNIQKRTFMCKLSYGLGIWKR